MLTPEKIAELLKHPVYAAELEAVFDDKGNLTKDGITTIQQVILILYPTRVAAAVDRELWRLLNAATATTTDALTARTELNSLVQELLDAFETK